MCGERAAHRAALPYGKDHSIFWEKNDMLTRKIYNEDHHMFRDSVRKMYQRELVPKVEKWEQDGITDRDFWLACGANGMLLPDIPEQYGGGGLDFKFNSIVLEETAFAGTTGPAFGVHNDIVAHYIHNYATEAVKQKWLPQMASGQAIGAQHFVPDENLCGPIVCTVLLFAFFVMYILDMSGNCCLLRNGVFPTRKFVPALLTCPQIFTMLLLFFIWSNIVMVFVFIFFFKSIIFSGEQVAFDIFFGQIIVFSFIKTIL